MFFFNENAEYLTNAFRDGPIFAHFSLSGYGRAARFRKRVFMQAVSDSALTNCLDRQHLMCSWRRQLCHPRQMEVFIMRLCCRIPTLSFFQRRSGLLPSPLGTFRGELEKIYHFYFAYKHFAIIRGRLF